MTYVKNIRPTKALDGDNPYHAQQISNPNIQHLRVLGSTVYVRLHEEERALKSEKWKPRALRGTLVGYDGQTIYRVHIREQNKVIRTKDLRYFEDYETRASNNLPDYRNTSTVQDFLLPDNDDVVRHDSEEDRPPLTQKLPKSKLTAIISTPRQGRKVSDVDDGASKATDKAFTPHNGRVVKRVRNANSKPTSNTQMSDLDQRQNKVLQKMGHHKVLRKGLDWGEHQDWEDTSAEEEANAFLTRPEEFDDEEGLLRILASRLLRENLGDQGEFAFATQLDVEEPETYNKAMSDTHAQEWSQAMK